MTLQTALILTRILVGIFFMIQSLEMLFMNIRHKPLGALAFIFHDWFFRQIFYSSALVLSMLLLFHGQALVIGALLALQILHLLYFRGSFNGGSDSVSIVLCVGMLLAHLPSYDDKLKQLGLALICANGLISYIVPGLSKLTTPSWWKGHVFYQAVHYSLYEVPNFIKKSVLPKTSFVLSWAIIVFQLSFLLIFFYPALCWPLLILGCFFHLANFWIFGLNRFFFAWLSFYPSIGFFFGKHF